MFELNFYIWFFSAWIYIGIILGYFAMKLILVIINNKDKTELEETFVKDLEEPMNWLSKSIGLSPITVLFLLVYLLCILLWPYFLFGIFKKKLRKK